MDYDTALNLPLYITSIFFHNIPWSLVLSIPVLIAAMVFASATISGAEVAFFGLALKDFELLEAEYPEQYTSIRKLLEHPHHLLASLLICNSLINVATIILFTLLVHQVIDVEHYKLIGFLLEAIIITFMLVVFAEVVPKIYANHFNISFARRTVPYISWLTRLSFPLAHIMVVSTRFIDRDPTQNNYKASIEEIDHAIDLATLEKSSVQEINMLKDIVKFSHISVKQIMRPRLDILALDAQMSFDDLLSFVKENGYSRYPVYHDSIDNIIGLLYTKDLLPYLQTDKSFRWQQLVHKAFFVPETRKINDLLRDFQSRMIHLAIVIDEFGGTSGLTTLEDVMEEIIGDIRDEFDDRTEVQFLQTGKNTYVFEGKILIHDMCRVLDIPTDSFEDIKGESDSIAGLVLELSGKLPQEKEWFEWQHYKFTVLKVENNTVKKVLLTISEPKNTTEDGN